MSLRVRITVAMIAVGAVAPFGCSDDGRDSRGTGEGGSGASGSGVTTGSSGTSTGGMTSGGVTTGGMTTGGTTGSGLNGWECSQGQFGGVPSCMCCNPSTCNASATPTPCSPSWTCCRHATTATGEVCACTDETTCDPVTAGNDTYVPVASCPP